MKRVVISLLLLVVSCTHSIAQKTGFPVVVARVKLVGQTQPIPPTTIFTPRSTGMFCAIPIIVEIVAEGNDRWQGSLQWTDVADEESLPLFSVQTSFVHTEPSERVPFCFVTQAGKPVKYFVKSMGGTNAGAYDIFIVIERLTKIPSF